MAHYHLLSTRRNPDGSYDTPHVDEVVDAPNDDAAVEEAVHFPLHRYSGAGEVVWLVDERGALVWAKGMREAA